jgi:hypothetical protein
MAEHSKSSKIWKQQRSNLRTGAIMRVICIFCHKQHYFHCGNLDECMLNRCWIARHEYLALHEEAMEKRRVAEEMARKKKEEAQKGKKGGRRPPPKKEPPKKKVQPQRSLISKDGQPSGELGRIYMAAPKDKHLSMLPNNRLPVAFGVCNFDAIACLDDVLLDDVLLRALHYTCVVASMHAMTLVCWWCILQEPSPRLRRFYPSAATAAVAAAAEDVGGFDFVNQARTAYVEAEIDSIENTVLQAQQASEYRFGVTEQEEAVAPPLPEVPLYPSNGSRGATPRGFNSSAPRGLAA